MNRIKLIICLIPLGFLLSCNHKSQGGKFKVQTLLPEKQIDMFSDSTFFGIIWSIIESEEAIYMSLDGRSQVVRLDLDMNLLATIGRQGRGPTELTSLINFAVVDDQVWFGDTWRYVLLKFSKDGLFISRAEIEKLSSKLRISSRFFAEDDKIYSSVFDGDKNTSMAVLDVASGESEHFGEITEFSSPVKGMRHNERNMFNDDDYIIASPKSLPSIERYDKKTLKLLESLDISKIPLVQRSIKEMYDDPNYKDENTFYYIFLDSYMNDDLLYISCPVYDDENGFRTGIMVFDVSHKIKYVKLLMIESPLAKFCVTDEYLFGVPLYGGELIRYKLES